VTLCESLTEASTGRSVCPVCFTSRPVTIRAAEPEALEWPSYFRAAFGLYGEIHADLLERDAEAAGRWKVAMLAAENELSDGRFNEFEKWDARAAAIEERVLGRKMRDHL